VRAGAALARASHAVMLSWGWRRAAIAWLAGALSVLALAPINAWPILFFTFPVAVWLIDGASAGRLGGVMSAAVAGWWFGFGYFVAGLYWTGFAMLVDAKTFAWLLPFAVLGLPAGLAFFFALAFAVARMMWTNGAMRILALAIALTAAEWLRGHVLTGFPWNTIGYALTGPLILAQASSLIGLWGLTFFATYLFAAPAVLADDRRETRRPLIVVLIPLVLLAVLAVYGTLRLQRTPTELVAGVKLRIMQPNLPQDTKFNYSARREVMARYLALSDRSAGPGATGVRDATHLIWPESAFPFFLQREPEAMRQIAELLPQGTVLIVGAARPATLAPTPGQLRAYNSIYVIDHDGSILSVYDKMHLVPFGEYLPFQNFLESLGLQQITKLPGGYIPGTSRKPLSIPRAPTFLPLVCYEVIFPGQAVPRGERPGWLVNVTNDGWFGNSSGPYQHLQQSRVRAIEEGLPLVRAANTGVSAVVDPVGRIVGALGLGTEGVLDSPLPRALPPTIYARLGDGPAILAFLAALALVLWRRARPRSKSTRYPL
jgi:apolipoprotein N-acyltransferase